MADVEAKPVYVLLGDDGFLLEHHRRHITEQLIGQADAQLCVATFEALAELPAVLAELRTLPFLAPRRVVIVRDADAFVSANRQELEDYLQDPSPTGSLILAVSSWNSATRIAKLVKSIGQIIICSVEDRQDLSTWIGQQASKRGKKMDPAAAAALQEHAGRDLALLQNEIEKLSLYVGDRPSITAEDIAVVTVSSMGPESFALTNAMTAQKPAAALAALEDAMCGRGEEFKIIGQIASHLRRVLRMHLLRQQGKNPQAAFTPNVPYPVRQQLTSLLDKRPLSKVQRDLARLISADLSLKSGADPVFAMQELVVGLCT